MLKKEWALHWKLEGFLNYNIGQKAKHFTKKQIQFCYNSYQSTHRSQHYLEFPGQDKYKGRLGILASLQM